MADEALRVEFKVALGNRRCVAKPAPGTKRAGQRRDRADRKARNLALAYWIDHLVRTGREPGLAAVALNCRVSIARVSKLVDLLGTSMSDQEELITSGLTAPLSR